jgi:arginyl-tRNA synthetase
MLSPAVALDFFGDAAANALASFRALDKKQTAALDGAVASIAAIASLDASLSAALATTATAAACSPSEVPLGLLVIAPTVSIALRLLGEATAAKYASLSASVAAIVASAFFAEALATANTLSTSARPTEATPAAAASAVATTGSAPSGPVVEIDVAASGLMSSLRKLFTDAVVAAFPQASALGLADAVVTKCTNEKFGDYQCNNAMALGKALKGMADYSGTTSYHIF